MYNAMALAPYVADAVWFIIGFFMILGMMANKEDKRVHQKTMDTPINKNVISNEEIIKQYKSMQ